MLKRGLLFIYIVLLLIPIGIAIDAASCSQKDVQAAIDSAEGQTEALIQMPACSVTWNSPVTIDMSSGSTRQLTIQGAGQFLEKGSASQTQITNAGFAITTKTDKKFRLSNIRFLGSGTASGEYIWMNGDTKPSLGGGFRIDHISFDGGSHAIQWYGSDSYGVIDHCTGGTNGQFSTAIWGTDHTRGGGSGSWSIHSSVGGSDAIYFEDNVLVQTDKSKKWMLCDGVNGARIVARYNTLTDYYLSGHDASSVDRGIFSYEGYGNTFFATGSQMNAPLSMRGGSGHFFNNKIIAESSTPFYADEATGIHLINYRSCGYGSVEPWTTACDSTDEKGCINGDYFHSLLCDSDADCTYGTSGGCSHPVKQGECVKIDGNEDGTGYPCRDQIGRSTNQELAPMLFWNNTISKAGGPATQIYPSVPSCSAAHIKENRDYCAHTTCSGTSCSYQCGTKLVNYNSYTYPHPLTQGSQPVCGNGIVESGEQCDLGNVIQEPCAYNLNCTMCSSCQIVPGQMMFCGDASCQSRFENCTSCAADCGQCQACGDGDCDAGETCLTCPADCVQKGSADINPCDGCIRQDELLSYIQLWKSGQATLTNLMEAIGLWKKGC
jgi:hypothetical protein